MPSLSIVIPIFDIQVGLEALHAGMSETIEALGDPTDDIILVDDGSQERSREAIRQLSTRACGGLTLSGNFGSTGAIPAGLSHARRVRHGDGSGPPRSARPGAQCAP